MKRPPTSFALVFVLAACLDRSSAPRVPGGGQAGAPAATAQSDEIGELLSALAKAADARPRDEALREVGPLEASGPEAHYVESESGEGNGSGFSRGAGGLGDRRAHAPDVIPGQANVRGSLDKEIIRRVVRRHIDEVKYCYEKELVRRRRLRGQAIFEFKISPGGDVASARLQGSTLRSPRTESCVVAAIGRWSFPNPLAHDVVTVSYPFYFAPGGADFTPTPPAHSAREVDELWRQRGLGP